MMGSTLMPMMKKPGNETIIASAGGRESEHRRGARAVSSERAFGNIWGHLGTI